MARRIMTLLVVVATAAVLIPTFAGAQYGTTTTTGPTTTTAAEVAGITVPSIPPVTLPTVPGATATTLKLSAADIDLDDLLSGNIAQLIQQLSGPERSAAARRVAALITEILAAGGIDINDIIIVGGATVEAGGDPNVPLTFSFSTDGYSAFAVVTFIVESDPQLLGTATADEDGSVSGTFELPRNLEPGKHTISAVGVGPDGQPVVSQQTITVAEPVEEEDEVAETEAAAPPADDDDGPNGAFIVIGLLVVLALVGGIVFSATGRKPAKSEVAS